MTDFNTSIERTQEQTKQHEAHQAQPARRPTYVDIEAARTPANGYNRAQLAEWGVPWPPPKGWKKKLLSQT